MNRSNSQRGTSQRLIRGQVYWVDEEIYSSLNQMYKEELEAILIELKIYQNIDSLKSDLNLRPKKSPIVVVMSGGLGQKSMKELHEKYIDKIIGVVIFCIQKEFHKKWALEYEDFIIDVVAKFEELKDAIGRSFDKLLVEDAKQKTSAIKVDPKEMNDTIEKIDKFEDSISTMNEIKDLRNEMSLNDSQTKGIFSSTNNIAKKDISVDDKINQSKIEDKKNDGKSLIEKQPIANISVSKKTYTNGEINTDTPEVNENNDDLISEEALTFFKAFIDESLIFRPKEIILLVSAIQGGHKKIKKAFKEYTISKTLSSKQNLIFVLRDYLKQFD